MIKYNKISNKRQISYKNILYFFIVCTKINKKWKFRMYLGLVLKKVRESHGLSISDIQKKTGINESQIFKIESGAGIPTDEQIIIFSNIYSISKDELFIQRDSDRLFETTRNLNTIGNSFETAKKKINLNDNCLFVSNKKLQGIATPLESRRYIGSKAKLVDWIFEIVDAETSGIKTATDIFAGTGVVAKRMLSKYECVNINDILFSNNQIYTAFFANKKWNNDKIVSKITEYNLLNAKNLQSNYFSENYGGKYFDYDMAKKIGFIREDIENSKSDLTEKEYAILLASLIYSIDRHANTVGHFEAYIKKPIKKTELDIKQIEVQNFPNAKIFRKDSNTLAKKLKSDLVYIDPPYNSRQYCRFYHVYETLVKWDKPVLYGVAMKPPAENMSRYCTAQAFEAFEDLVENLDAKYLAVSYNNTYNSKSGSSKNKITLKQIEEILNKKGSTKIFAKDYRFFNAGKTDLKNHQELLFITKVK